jgi:anti-anti-sigma factor
MAAGGHAVFEVAPDGTAGENVDAPMRELDWMVRLAAEIDRPVSFAFGEIDAASADYFADGIEQHIGGYRQLVLDLSQLEFFGTAGYGVLDRVRERCAGSAADWVLVPGPEVDRLLRLSGRRDTLPRAADIDAAMATLERRQTGWLSRNTA